MLTHHFTQSESPVLLVTFAPSAAQEKFLFHKAAGLNTADVLAFNDTADNYYLDHHREIAELIDAHCTTGKYQRLVIAGYSAGAFIACVTVSNISFNGPVTIHAFSPYVRLDAPYSNAWHRLRDRIDLRDFHLLDVINRAPPEHQFHLYFATDSVRDGIHLRDSFDLDRSNARIHYLNCGHDTTVIVRGDYPASLQPLIDGSLHVPQQFIASAEELVRCLMLTDLGVKEQDGSISAYATPAISPRSYSAEFCYWHSRQLARMGHIANALQWGWASVIKAQPNCPDSIPETLGHIAFDHGKLHDAMDAYRLMSKPTDEVLSRLAKFGHLTRSMP